MEHIVLAYETRSSKGLYTDLAKAVYPNIKVVSVSNFRNTADIWTGAYIYKELGQFDDEDYKAAEIEIVNRCRFLRSLDGQRAKELASKVWKGISSIFAEYKVVAVFQRMIDEYTLDITERIAKIHDVPVVSFVGHFFNGYFRITTRGELNELREQPSQSEIETVCESVLSSGYKPSFDRMKKKSQTQVIKTFLRRRLIETLYYPMMKKWDCDPLNYHYNTAVLRGADFSYVSKHRYDGFASIDDISQLSLEKVAYLPLHMIPEATTDYWCNDWRLSDYENGIIKMIEASDRDVVFVVKEHPSMDGWRNPDFYKQLSSLQNVYLIPPHENSNRLLDLVANVVVHTGSVGVEALMRGKRTFCLTPNYYSKLHPAVILCSSIRIEQMMESIPEYELEVFVGNLLQGLYPGIWMPNKKCRESSFDALVDASRAYIERYHA